MEIREFIGARGISPFARWFDGLDPRAAAKVAVALARMERGNPSNAKAVGAGLHEYRIDWGPGYRIYYRQTERTVVLLLCGGTKGSQREDIELAMKMARDLEHDDGA